jgi:glycerophosphoryl diester phosphodiesterase
MAPLIVAHRGDSARFPENTAEAFRGAVEAGADMVELDVQLTKDGKVVVLHDATLDRTTTGSGSVSGKTLAEVKALSAHFPSRFGEAFRGATVPTLSEALDVLRGKAGVLVEMKKESVDESGALERETVASVQALGMEKEATLISFAPQALKRCLKLAPEIRRGHLFSRGAAEDVLGATRAAGCEIVMPEKGMLTPALAESARSAGLLVVTWVVDDPEELRALGPLGLYGVCTNAPRTLLDAIWESE